MPIWKIIAERPVKLTKTKPKEENLLEEHLENWIVKDPSILGEPLLLIGRQVRIQDVGDRLDILALDSQGNAVVVELKRGKLTSPVDMQALRYASYISKWRFEDFENQARAFLGKVGDVDFNFIELYEQFCEESGVDEIPVLNSDQRLILVGSEVKDKLGSVALWLLDHGIDIKVIEVEVYRDGDTVLVQPQVVIPQPVSRFDDTGRASGSVDGKNWHLNKRCSPTTRAWLLRLIETLRTNFEIDGPRWNRRDGVVFQVSNRNWLIIGTRTTLLALRFPFVEAGVFSQPDLAQRLGVEEFVREAPLSERRGLSNSVSVWSKNETTDKVILRVKEDFDWEGDSFLAFLSEAYAAFPK